MIYLLADNIGFYFHFQADSCNDLPITRKTDSPWTERRVSRYEMSNRLSWNVNDVFQHHHSIRVRTRIKWGFFWDCIRIRNTIIDQYISSHVTVLGGVVEFLLELHNSEQTRASQVFPYTYPQVAFRFLFGAWAWNYIYLNNGKEYLVHCALIRF